MTSIFLLHFSFSCIKLYPCNVNIAAGNKCLLSFRTASTHDISWVRASESSTYESARAEWHIKEGSKRHMHARKRRRKEGGLFGGRVLQGMQKIPLNCLWLVHYYMFRGAHGCHLRLILIVNPVLEIIVIPASDDERFCQNLPSVSWPVLYVWNEPGLALHV